MKHTFVVVHLRVQRIENQISLFVTKKTRANVCVCVCALCCPCRPIDSCICAEIENLNLFRVLLFFLRFLCMSVRPAVSQSLDYQLVRFHSLALPSPLRSISPFLSYIRLLARSIDR